MLYLSAPNPSELYYSQLAVLALTLLTAIYFDIKKRQIPNDLVLSGVLILLALQTYQQSWQPLSLLVGIFIGLSLWQLKFMGGGDSKLLMLVSAAFAPTYLLTLYLCISLMGGLQAALALCLGHDKKLPYVVAIGAGTLMFLAISFAFSSEAERSLYRLFPA